MERKLTVLWTSIFVAGFVSTVAAIYLYVDHVFAAVATVGGLTLPLIRFLFPRLAQRTNPIIRGVFSRPWRSATAAIVIWTCFVGILIATGDLIIAPFVERHQFRNEPKTLTRGTIKQLVVNKGFFDQNLNRTGTGVTNLFDRQELTDDLVIIDRSTGLMWEYCQLEQFVEYSEAITHVEKMNTERLGGFQNWRLPTIEEAYSILETDPVKIDRYTLHLDPKNGELCPFIWTSDWDPKEDEPWVVSYLTGDALVSVTNNITRENKFSVRAVRSISTP